MLTHGWFRAMGIKSCLDNGNIQLNMDGSLTIIPSAGTGPCFGVASQIRSRILNSGVLDLY
jgi:hypothetical protein